MKAVILDTDKNEATVMTEGGDIIGIKNNGYEIGQEIILRSGKKRASINRITGIVAAAAAALVITGGIGGYAYYTPYGTVSLDVNPSIEYTINRFDRVLEVNGIRLEATNEEVAETGLAVAAGTMGYQELLNWVIDHRA